MPKTKTKRRCGGRGKGRTARNRRKTQNAIRDRERAEYYNSQYMPRISSDDIRNVSLPIGKSKKYEGVDVSKLLVADKYNLFRGHTYFVVDQMSGKRMPAKFVRYPKTRYTQYMDGPDTSNAVFSHNGREFRISTDDIDVYEVNAALRLKSTLQPELWREVSSALYNTTSQR